MQGYEMRRVFNSYTVHVHALDVASLKAWDVVAAASEASTQVMDAIVHDV